MATDKKRELVDFLVKKAFNPVLHAKADGRSEAEKRKLEHVRDATQAEIGKIVGLPVAVEEIDEEGIPGVIEKLVAASAGQGFTPLSAEEYDAFARELAAQHQRESLAEAMREYTKYRAIDPSRVDALLAAHKGRLGGDA